MNVLIFSDQIRSCSFLVICNLQFDHLPTPEECENFFIQNIQRQDTENVMSHDGARGTKFVEYALGYLRKNLVLGIISGQGIRLTVCYHLWSIIHESVV